MILHTLPPANYLVFTISQTKQLHPQLALVMGLKRGARFLMPIKFLSSKFWRTFRWSMKNFLRYTNSKPSLKMDWQNCLYTKPIAYVDLVFEDSSQQISENVVSCLRKLLSYLPLEYNSISSNKKIIIIIFLICLF